MSSSGGFSAVTGLETIVSADNASFDGTARGGALTTNGQLFVGSTSSPHVKKGNITSPLGTITIGYSSPNITIDLSGGGAAIDSIHPDAFTAPGTDPIVPTVAGLVTITGAQVSSGTIGANVIRTDSLAANTMTIEIQRSTSAAATDSTKNGVSHFDSAKFSVDSSGFVSASGTGLGQTITGQSGGALAPTAGNWNISGSTVVAGTSPLVTSGSGSTLTINAQRSQAIAATDSTKIGLAAFDSARFTVDANGFVSASGTGLGETITGQSGGALSPTAGNWNISGGSVVAGTSPLVTSGSGSTLTINAQRSQAIAATDSTKVGLAAFDSARFTVDASGFVSLSGAGVGQTITGTSGGALSPSSGNWNILGASTAAGTSPVSTSGSGSTLTVNVQKSQAIASTDATKIGLSNFNSGQFGVDANGFVSLGGSSATSYVTSSGTATPSANVLNITQGTGILTSGSGNTVTVGINTNVATTYNTQSGTATPSSNIITFNGGPGVTTSASGSTVTINSVTFNDRSADSTLAVNNGFFCTAALTATLPSSPTQGTLCIIVSGTASAIVVQASSGKFIRVGSLISSSAGTATSTAIGDCLELRYQTTNTTWYATSIIGTWLIA